MRDEWMTYRSLRKKLSFKSLWSLATITHLSSLLTDLQISEYVKIYTKKQKVVFTKRKGKHKISYILLIAFFKPPEVCWQTSGDLHTILVRFNQNVNCFFNGIVFDNDSDGGRDWARPVSLWNNTLIYGYCLHGDRASPVSTLLWKIFKF